MPYSMDCPATQAISQGQAMWRSENKSRIDDYNKGTGEDPGQGVFWLSQGIGEALPEPIK